jgi:hypothetical protein
MARNDSKNKKPSRLLIGSLTHLVIQEMLRAGHRQPSLADVISAVSAHPEVRANTGSLGGARQQVIGGVSSYFRFFCPEESWDLESCETPVEGSRLDVVWRGSRKKVLVDEIKAGRPEGLATDGRHSRQRSKQVGGANELYAKQLTGVRSLYLGAPSESFITRPDGTVEPLNPQEEK